MKKESPFELLKKQIKSDPEYAWGWQCNLAMPAFDEGVDIKTANKIAARIMKNFFDCDVTKLKEWDGRFDPNLKIIKK